MKVKIKITRSKLSTKFATVDLGDMQTSDDPSTNANQAKKIIEKIMVEDIDFRDRNFECYDFNDEIEILEWDIKEK